MSRPGGGLGAVGELPPEELEEDPEEDSSLAGTGDEGPGIDRFRPGRQRPEVCFTAGGGKSGRPSRRGGAGGYQAIARVEKRIRFDFLKIFKAPQNVWIFRNFWIVRTEKRIRFDYMSFSDM